ncbi:hypothetical protein B0H15DRAFT_574726 [Mycena belliarum]|uniref:Uncharacterized protein n=1 Tax=Mycena belliarum TaxID=1033014 RepID=A0AAD6TRK5_9AGAR|nr:hypothetical protein B0H15DRAFT_574726 [Mycena belliae]
MGAKYLCCLPLRLGVLLISFVQFLVSAAAAAGLTYLLVLDSQGKFDTQYVTNRVRIIAIVVAVVYGIFALISLTGFIGAIRKKESYVGAFSNLLRFFLGLTITVVIAYFILYFVDKSQFRKLCIGSSTDQNVINACNGSTKLSVWAMVISAIIPILFQAYGVYIVSAYVKKLHNEQFLHQESFGYKGPGYVPVHEETHPLTHQGAYPYADNSHSFGGQHV